MALGPSRRTPGTPGIVKVQGGLEEAAAAALGTAGREGAIFFTVYRL
jgi:hypothetical protein